MQRIGRSRAVRACLLSTVSALVLAGVVGVWAVVGEGHRHPDTVTPATDPCADERKVSPFEFELAPVERELGVMLTL